MSEMREAHKIRSALGNVSVARMFIESIRSGRVVETERFWQENVLEPLKKAEETLQAEAKLYEVEGVITVTVNGGAVS